MHDKSIHFMEMSALESASKNQKPSKVKMKSAIHHDFPRPDLLEGPKDGKFFFILKSSKKVHYLVH